MIDPTKQPELGQDRGRVPATQPQDARVVPRPQTTGLRREGNDETGRRRDRANYLRDKNKSRRIR